MIRQCSIAAQLVQPRLMRMDRFKHADPGRSFKAVEAFATRWGKGSGSRLSRSCDKFDSHWLQGSESRRCIVDTVSTGDDYLRHHK